MARVALPKLRRKVQPIRSRGPKPLQPVLLRPPERLDTAGEPPAWWRARFPSGDRPEWWAYWALLRLGLRDGIDFIYQSGVLGGRLQRGGAVADFEILDPPMVIAINGEYWHYYRGSGKQALDDLQRFQLSDHGYQVITIDVDDLERDPIYYMSQALQGIDHSRVARGFS